MLGARLSMLPWDGVTFSREPSRLLNKEAKPSPLKESEECLLVQPEGQHPLFCRPFRPLALCLEAWPHPHPKKRAWAWLPWVMEGEARDPVRCHTPRKLWLRVCVCVCAPVSVPACLYGGVFACFVCLCLHLCLCASLCVFVYLCVCICA